MNFRTIKITACILIGLTILAIVAGRIIVFQKLRQAIISQVDVLDKSGIVIDTRNRNRLSEQKYPSYEGFFSKG